MHFENNILDFSSGKLSDAALCTLVDSGNYGSATGIRFRNYQVSEACILHIIRSGAFPALMSLKLTDTAITDVAACAIANEAIGFDCLEILDLGAVPAASANSRARRDGAGVSDALVVAIANSPRLTALKRILRSEEHHVYETGASLNWLPFTQFGRNIGEACTASRAP
jgi:hypothetical protein